MIGPFTFGPHLRPMEVRHPESDDELRAVVLVNRRAWLEAYDEVLPESVLADVAARPTEEELDARVASMRADRGNLLVAVDEGAVVGYANVRWRDDRTKEFVGRDEAGLKELYVDPDHWSAGVGTALLEAAVDLADDATALRLEVLESNDVGRRFYEARGFERTGSDEFEVEGERLPTVVYALAL